MAMIIALIWQSLRTALVAICGGVGVNLSWTMLSDATTDVAATKPT